MGLEMLAWILVLSIIAGDSRGSNTVKGTSMAISQSHSNWHLCDAKLVTAEEFRKILSYCKEMSAFDPYFHLMYDAIAICVNTGLRISEALHIEKADVLESRLMVIRRKKKWLAPAPIEVNPGIHKLIRDRADRVEEGFIFPGQQSPCIIQHTGKRALVLGAMEQFCVGGHASIRNVQRRWREIVTELGLYKYGRGIHTTRHRAISAIYEKTKDIMKAKEFAGHSSPDMTANYCHITDMRETLGSMETVL
jgi:integrase